MTLKLVPLLLKPETLSLLAPDAFTMLIGSFCQVVSEIDPVCPFRVAKEFEKCAVPKFANGSIPPEYGASMIHSAELRAALCDVNVMLKLPPVVALASSKV